MLRLVFWGTPQFAVPSLKQLLIHPDVEVLGVVTQPDKRRGRGNQLMPSPIKQLALDYGLAIWQPAQVKKDAQTLTELRSHLADAFVVVAYGQILSAEILAMPRLGCVNAHGSLLPAYRGAAPIQWSIYDGNTTTGVTTMRMDVGMDTGPMLLKQSIVVGLLEDATTVAARLADVSAALLVETLQQLDQGRIEPIPQDDAIATYARLLQKSDFLIDWANPAIAIHNQVRGFMPNGIAQFRGQPLKILQTVPLDVAYLDELPPAFQVLAQDLAKLDQPQLSGTVVVIAKTLGPVIQTGTGLLLLLKVQPAGKRQQSGWDFANGLRMTVGDRLENGRLD